MWERNDVDSQSCVYELYLPQPSCSVLVFLLGEGQHYEKTMPYGVNTGALSALGLGNADLLDVFVVHERACGRLSF